MKTKLQVPLESVEDEIFANYLRAKGYYFSHIANETSIKNWGYLNKMKRLGKNRGVPDYLVIVPDKSGNTRLLFVEMKRKGASAKSLSKEQNEWLEALNNCVGVKAYWADGADRAIETVEYIRKCSI